MTRVETLHREAMELAELADLARLEGDAEKQRLHLWQAYEKERTAALEYYAEQNLEPTRSILLRSAASLALECEEKRESERLAAVALSGEPPPEIAEELRDILAKARTGHKDEVTFEITLKVGDASEKVTVGCFPVDRELVATLRGEGARGKVRRLKPKPISIRLTTPSEESRVCLEGALSEVHASEKTKGSG